MNVRTIRPGELYELRKNGKAVDLVDVRTPVEFREIHAEGARLVPLDCLDAASVRAGRTGNGDEPLFLICRAGNRGRQACARLLAAGLQNVVNVEGGTLAWEQAGLPVVRGKKAISLERQVRLVVGSLVILGTILGWLVHPAWAALSAVMGAGLVYVGITDTCVLGMLLARMPWNRVKDSPAKCCAAKAASPLNRSARGGPPLRVCGPVPVLCGFGRKVSGLPWRDPGSGKP